MLDKEDVLQFQITVSSGRKRDIWKEIRREEKLRQYLESLYKPKKKRGKWEWILLVYVTLLILIIPSVSDTAGYDGNSFANTVLFLIFIWCLIAFRSFRKAAGAGIRCLAKLLLREIASESEPEEIRFYDDYFVFGNPETHESRFNYTFLEHISEKRELFFLVLQSHQGIVIGKDNFLVGKTEEFQTFLIQKKKTRSFYKANSINCRFAACHCSDERTLKAISMRLSQPPVPSKGYRCFMGAAAIAALVFLVHSMLEGQIARSAGIFSFLLCLFFMYLESKKRSGKRWQKAEQEKKLRNLKEKEWKNPDSQTFLWFDENDFTLKNDYITMVHSYQDIKKWEPHQDYYLIILKSSDILVLWKDRFSMGAPEAFSVFLSEKTGNIF